MSRLKEFIRKFVLANAFEHGGRAQVGAIIGKLIASGIISKTEIGQIKPEIDAAIKAVGKLALKVQEAELRRIYPEFFVPKAAEEKTVPQLPKSWRGKVVTRFEPSPSGPMHIGHAYTLASNLELARQYKGKCIIRVSDTNPENIYPGSYDLLKEDAKWLSNGFVKSKDFVVQSDRMRTYYRFADKAIKIGIAYVCTCDSVKWRKLMLAKKACVCRDLLPPEHLGRWKRMLKDWKEGVAVVRIKTELGHKNPAMRDWPALRINAQSHPRHGKKFRVWPLMNFAEAIDDHEMGVTHAFRAKEHRDNAKRQQYLYDAFSWDMPQHWYLGAINFIGFKLSTTKAKQAIEAGKYKGWDDVRLPFIAALRRRGYCAGTFIKYGLSAASETDKTVRIDEFFKMIDKFNREVVDADAKRFFFVDSPVKITLLTGFPKEVKLKSHPDKQATRTVKVKDIIYVTKDDFKKYGGKRVRLKGLANVVLSKSAKLIKPEDVQTIHWVSSPNCKVEILMPDGKVVKGLGEPLIGKIKSGVVVQFERFGFVRCEGKNKFVFGHR